MGGWPSGDGFIFDIGFWFTASRGVECEFERDVARAFDETDWLTRVTWLAVVAPAQSTLRFGTER